jgi:hypothetical protein
MTLPPFLTARSRIAGALGARLLRLLEQWRLEPLVCCEEAIASFLAANQATISRAGPTVRIRFPPAESLQTFGPSRPILGVRRRLLHHRTEALGWNFSAEDLEEMPILTELMRMTSGVEFCDAEMIGQLVDVP